MIAWQDLAVSSVPILGMKEPHPRFTIFAELAKERIALPSLCVESTIEEILECMGLEEKPLKGNTKSLKKSC